MTTRTDLDVAFSMYVANKEKTIKKLRLNAKKCSSLAGKIAFKRQLAEARSELSKQRLHLFSAEDLAKESLRHDDAGLFLRFRKSFPSVFDVIAQNVSQ